MKAVIDFYARLSDTERIRYSTLLSVNLEQEVHVDREFWVWAWRINCLFPFANDGARESMKEQ